jgi:hypothetical protein
METGGFQFCGIPLLPLEKFIKEGDFLNFLD